MTKKQFKLCKFLRRLTGRTIDNGYEYKTLSHANYFQYPNKTFLKVSTHSSYLWTARVILPNYILQPSILTESIVELSEGDKNVSEGHIKWYLCKALKDFKRNTLKQPYSNILWSFQWQNFKGLQLPDFFCPGLDSMPPWHKRSKAKNKTRFRLDIE